MTAEVSVVCVTYNSRAHIGSLLESLRANTAGVQYDVTVVDNASGDGTARFVREQFPDARLVARATNAGLSAAINEGVAESSGDLIAVLNPDVRVLNDAIPALATYLRENPDAGIVAPKLLDDDGTLQLSCRAFPGYATALFSRYSLLSRVFPRNRHSRRYLMADFDHTRTTDVDWVSGAALMFPRAVFERVGGWDAGLFLFSEDVDFCKRVHDAGYRVVYHPQAVVHHSIGISKRPTRRIVIERHKSMWRYYRKHMRRNAALDALTAGGIGARCAATLAAMYTGRAVRRARH